MRMLDRLFAGALVVPFALGLSAGTTDHGRVAFTFHDREIVESSGLVVQHGLVLTTNDSGDSGRVFAVDPETGETVGVTRWSESPTDVEALAPAKGGGVWVGDIGDNTGSRDSVSVTRVPVGRGERTVEAPSYELVYPRGPVNAETLMADPTSGRLYVATKSVFGGTLYAAPAVLSPDRPNRLRPLGRVLPIATDGTFLPDGRHLVVRDYSQAVVYSFPDLEEVGRFRLPAQQQGEGLAVLDATTLLVSTEGQSSDVLRVPLPADVRRALVASAPPGAQPSARPSPQPAPQPAPGEQPDELTDRPLWPWLVTGGAGLVGLLVLLRSLRRR